MRRAILFAWIVVAAEILVGCGSIHMNSRYVPARGQSNTTNAMIERNGSALFVLPQTVTFLGDGAFYVPIVPPIGKNIAYLTPLYYPRGVQSTPYTFVEILVDPAGNDIELDLTRVTLVKNGNVLIADEFSNLPPTREQISNTRDRRKAWQGAGLLCREWLESRAREETGTHLSDLDLLPIQAGRALRMNRKSWSCFALKFSIATDVTNPFSIVIDGVKVDGAMIPPTTFSYVKERIETGWQFM